MANPHKLAAHVADRSASAQGQRASQLRAQHLEHLQNSFGAGHCESPEHGAADADGLRTERDGLHHIGAAPDSAVEQHRNASVNRRDNRRQKLDRGRNRVELASTVIGNDDRAYAPLDCESRVIGVRDAFQGDGQSCRLAKPINVLPGQLGRKNDRSRPRRSDSSLRLSHILAAQSRGQIDEAIAPIALAVPEHWRIDGDYQRGAARGLSTTHQRFGETEVGLNVELKPDGRLDVLRRRASSGRCDVFDRHCRSHARNQDRISGDSGPSSRAFAIGMSEAMKRRRRDENGH